MLSRLNLINRFFLFSALVIIALPVYAVDSQPLSSWKDGDAKARIIDFVDAVTDKKSSDYVPPEKRVAVFDNDGTLWCEKPVYPQFVFAIDRVEDAIKKHPELKEDPVFKAALARDYDALARSGAHGIQKLIGVTHSGMTASQFEEIVMRWMKKKKHPRFKKHFNKCIYQPMLEVLNYFRANGFRTYIVSGGGRDFMRPWTVSTYGIEPERIAGSYCKLEFRDGDVYRTSTIEFLNDGKEKPVGIQSQIGVRPIAAFGNSDGDYEMLAWTSKGKGRKLCALIHHTDGTREYAYDRQSKVGHLEKGLDESKERGWLLVDMKKDWLKIFPSR